LNDAVHGPSQLLRAAALFTCRNKQSRDRDDVDANSDRNPCASAGSATRAASNTKARSFARPSPFTSLPTTGVNGSPELAFPNSETPNHRCEYPAEIVISCRGAKSARADEIARGSSNVAPSNPRASIRASVNVYVPSMFHRPRNWTFGLMRRLACRAQPVRSDVRLSVRPNWLDTRPAAGATTPDEATMLDIGTNTGRSASSGSANFTEFPKLRSTTLG
jgi:hypothetical protein